MSKGAILLISYHFYPSSEVGAKRPSETALHLASRGYDVTVLRAVDRARRVDPQSLAGLHLLSVVIPPRRFTAVWKWLKGRVADRSSRVSWNGPAAEGARGSENREAAATAGLVRRLRRHVRAFDTVFQSNKRWICKAAFRVYLECRRKRYDLVIASGPPIAGYIGGWFASRIGGAPLLLDMRDPWYLHGDDERSDEAMIRDHPLARLENEVGQRCIRASSAIVAASSGIRGHTLERFAAAPDKTIYVVRNGYDGFSRIDRPPPAGRLEMLYAGSLYWNRNPFPFLEALERAVSGPDKARELVKLRLVGNCRKWNGIELQPWLLSRGLQDVVEILPFAQPKALRDLMTAANVLVNFSQGQPRQIPAKSYEYLASGRDVIVVAESYSDVAVLFREAHLGEIVEPHDIDGIETAIRAMYDRYVVGDATPVRSTADLSVYAREAQLDAFETIVERTIRLNGR